MPGWEWNKALANVGQSFADAIIQRREDQRQQKALDDVLGASMMSAYTPGASPGYPTNATQMRPLSDPAMMGPLMNLARINPGAFQSYMSMRQMAQPQYDMKEIPRGGTLGVFSTQEGQPPKEVGELHGQPFYQKPTSRLLLPNEIPPGFEGIPKGAQVYGYREVDPDTNQPQTTITRVQPLSQYMLGAGGVGDVDPETLAFYAPLIASDPLNNISKINLGFGVAGTIAKLKLLKASVPYAMQLGSAQAAVVRNLQIQASKGALAQLTKNKSAVEAFSGTARKNWELFLNTAKDVVDSGSPWVNMPLRAVDRQSLGSKELAAYNAARQVATTEISRVISNPNLVGVLSDQARQELQSIVPGEATLGQLYSISNVLLQDMDNRKSSIDDTIRDINADVLKTITPQGPTPAPATPGGQLKPTHRYNPQTGKIEAIQ